jgi:hypothetical protein
MVITPQMVVLVLAILWQILQKVFQVAQTGTPADITAELAKLETLKLRSPEEIEAEADAVSKAAGG